MRKNILISGAGSGIGRAMAIALSNENYNCILLGRNALSLQKTLINLSDGDHHIAVVDICDAHALMDFASKFKNPIDGIIANAGIGGENKFGISDRWNEIIQTNLTGTYQFVQTFLPLLKASNSDFKQIIITSSILAKLGVANYSAYCASKAGLLGLMRSWAVEYAAENILVNAICPGWVNTQMAQNGLQGIADGIGISKEEFYQMAMQDVPLKKMSEPSEIAELVCYLMKQKSITGQSIDVNNGAIMS